MTQINNVTKEGVAAAGTPTLAPATQTLPVIDAGVWKSDTINHIVDARIAALLGRGGLITEGASSVVQELALGAAGNVKMSDGTDLVNALITQVLAQAPPLGLEQEWLSSTTFRVRAGSCWTRDGLTRLALAADVTVDIATNGASGMDRKALTGTVSGTSGTKTITGSGTAFLTEFNRRVLTGTFSNGGGTTTITATSGDPIKDAPMIGDLVGNDSIGYRRVTQRNFTAIGAFTLTVSTAHGSFSGATLYVIETPPFSVTGDSTLHAVDQIASNTGLTLIDNLGASPSGAVAYTGTRYPYRIFPLWLCSDGNVYVSPRWDAPLNGLAGRMIGLVPLGAAGALAGKCFAGRDGWLCRLSLMAPSATAWAGASEQYLQEVATNTQPVRRPRRWKALVAVALSNAADNLSVPIITLYPQTGVTNPRVYTGGGGGTVDNAEHGTAKYDTAWIEEIIGDGSVYAILVYITGNNGTLNGSYRRDGVEVLL